MSYINARREEEKDRRRNEIVDATVEIYREVGWDEVTMDAVARRARLSRALIYVYFKDKRELHFALAQRAMELLGERFAEAIKQPVLGIDKVEAIGRAYVTYAHELPHFFDATRRLQWMPAGEPSPYAMQCVAAEAGVYTVVEEAIRIGQADGSIRKDLVTPELTSRVLWGFAHGMIQVAMNKAQSLARRNLSVPEFLQHAFDLLRSSLAPAKK